MGIPKYDEMYLELLQVLANHSEPQKISAIRDVIAADYHLTEEERRELLPSGKQLLFNSRITWSCTYLKQAGLIENVSRGIYRLTSAGKAVLNEHPSVIDNKYLERFESFREFIYQSAPPSAKKKNSKDLSVPSHTEANQSPQDVLEAAYTQINSTLIENILSEIMNQTPEFFEHLVVKLLTQMGYGGSLEDAAIVTKISCDEGIDGIIREDKLGFSSIYIQAKRWDRHNTVGRPELQKFVGALAGQGASKGLFITTAQFTKEAREYVDKHLGAKIVLIDGVSLAKLMIEYNVGVSIEATYFIKKIDSDFFDDSLI